MFSCWETRPAHLYLNNHREIFAMSLPPQAPSVCILWRSFRKGKLAVEYFKLQFKPSYATINYYLQKYCIRDDVVCVFKYGSFAEYITGSFFGVVQEQNCQTVELMGRYF